jgi:hypothetical protein
MRKSEFYDSIKDVVLFRDDVRDDLDDCLIYLVLENLRKIDAFRICWSRYVVEIRCDEWKKERVYQTLNFCFFNENHDVVWATKKRNDEFERRCAILCSFD